MPGLTVEEFVAWRDERQLARGVRRACEVLQAIASIDFSGVRRTSKCPMVSCVDRGINGSQCSAEHRKKLGHPWQLLKDEAQRCIDSVLYVLELYKR